MHNGLSKQIVETTIVAALTRGLVDGEQRLGFVAAHRLAGKCRCAKNARAQGGIIGIERTGEMNTTAGGRPLAGDHAVADESEGLRRSAAIGDGGRFDGAEYLGNGSGGHFKLFYLQCFLR